MWTLPSPHVNDSESDIARALTYADGSPVFAITQAQVESILELYSVYGEVKGKPDPRLTGPALAKELLDAMHNAYGEVYEGRRLASIRERIKLGALKCPYCGFGEIKDLDHHIPRSLYKALSIYPLNLIPCCHPCNNKKRAVAGDTPDAQFFHTYLDNVTLEKFFHAEVAISAAGLSTRFFLEKPLGFNDDAFERLNFQFIRLELDERLKPEVTTFISSQRTAIETVAEGGSASLKRFLEKARDNSIRDFGNNHWQTALWGALASSEDFYNGGYIHSFGKITPGA